MCSSLRLLALRDGVRAAWVRGGGRWWWRFNPEPPDPEVRRLLMRRQARQAGRRVDDADGAHHRARRGTVVYNEEHAFRLHATDNRDRTASPVRRQGWDAGLDRLGAAVCVASGTGA
ncbi:hypothetical protein GCM10022220_07650 [Actinocatenispora rupis]|uniref:Uncharacterized protein n=1 Tax=Actinocatenispora rupis TaxID=519421 RepID=A0A8J3NB41_9ACTN|nr:hypothetical protein Aru02nite_11260 [Actinocatenispora rupis]